MSDIFNPIGRSLPGFTGPAVVTGVISDPPRALLGAVAGTILKGTVLGRGPDGLTTIVTDKGTVQVATAAQLPAGSTVMLEVRNAGDRLQVLILSIDASTARTQAPQGQSGQTATSGVGGAGSGTSAGGTAPSGSAGAPSGETDAQGNVRPPPPTIEVVGTTLQAIAVQAPAPNTLLPTPEIEVFAPPTQPVTVPADAAQKAQILAQTALLIETEATVVAPGQPFDPATSIPAPNAPVVIPAAGLTPEAGAAPAPLPGTAVATPTVVPPAIGTTLQPEVAQQIASLFAAAAEAKPGAIATLPATLLAKVANAAAPVAAPQFLEPGSELSLHVIAVLPVPGAEIEIAPDAARLAGATPPLIGHVLGYTRAGFPVIDTPAGALMLQQRTRLPIGAQVALVLEPAMPPATVVPPVTSPDDALLYLSRGWPSLDDLVAVLRGPGGAQADTPTLASSGLPQTGTKLAAGIANAISALRNGEVERLLGPLLAGRKMPVDKEEAIRKLKDEFAQLSELAKDRPGVDWRALFLPVYDARMGLTQINLYYRYAGGGAGEDAEKKRGTRFLVDVDFAVLGAFQLDGLIRDKRFDLMIRSRRRLSQGQRRDIIGIFEEALAIGGCTGGLEFRAVDAFPVSPLDELRKSHGPLTA